MHDFHGIVWGAQGQCRSYCKIVFLFTCSDIFVLVAQCTALQTEGQRDGETKR